MGHKVTKAFPYAADGQTTRDTVVGETINDINPDHVQGLIDGGYIAPEAASKMAGDALLAADHAGEVDSDKAVHEEAAVAAAGISDGHVGAPEAATIVDAHKLTDLSDPVTVQAAQDEKAAHEAGDADFDPKAPDAVADAAAKVEKGSDPFDHDGDGKPGGSKPRAKKPAAKQ